MFFFGKSSHTFPQGSGSGIECFTGHTPKAELDIGKHAGQANESRKQVFPIFGHKSVIL